MISWTELCSSLQDSTKVSFGISPTLTLIAPSSKERVVKILIFSFAFCIRKSRADSIPSLKLVKEFFFLWVFNKAPFYTRGRETHSYKRCADISLHQSINIGFRNKDMVYNGGDLLFVLSILFCPKIRYWKTSVNRFLFIFRLSAWAWSAPSSGFPSSIWGKSDKEVFYIVHPPPLTGSNRLLPRLIHT